MLRTTHKRGNAARTLNSARANHVPPPSPKVNHPKPKPKADNNAHAGPSRLPYPIHSDSSSPKMPGALEIPSFVYPTPQPADEQPTTPRQSRRASGPERTRERGQRRMDPLSSSLSRPSVNQDPDLGSDVFELLKLAEFRTAGRQLTREQQQFLSDLRHLAENTYEARRVTMYEDKIARATLEAPERERQREEKRRLHREKLAREEREATERKRREDQWVRFKAEAERLRVERMRRLAEQEETRKRAREDHRRREEAEAAAFEAQRQKQRRDEEARRQCEEFDRQRRQRQQEQRQHQQQFQQQDANGKVWDVFGLYDAKWREIRKPQAPLVNIDAVQLPWPVLTPGEVTEARVREFMLHPQRYAHSKDKIRSELLNWHPDKFEARVLPIVREGERVIVKQLAVEVARWIMDLSAELS